MKTIHQLTAVSAATCSLLLSGCGGGDGANANSAPNATATVAAGIVPAAAGASAQSFVDYQKTMQPSETSGALSLQEFTPPKDETSFPFPIG